MPRAPDIDGTFIQIIDFMGNRVYEPQYASSLDEKVNSKKLEQYHNNFLSRGTFISDFNRMKNQR